MSISVSVCQGHRGTHKKFTQTMALALMTLESKRPLIVVVANKSCIVNNNNIIINITVVW